MSVPTHTLDHIVYRLADGKLNQGVEEFRQQGFTVVIGGKHTDNLTENALIILASGIYIELISFIEPSSSYPPDSPRNKHRWASTSLGWIEWAHHDASKPGESHIYEDVNSRSPDGGKIYAPPVNGGRERTDGVVLKWTITGSYPKFGTGNVPFFCQDITDRSLRVPTSPPSNAAHANSAIDIHSVHLHTSSSAFSTREKEITAVLGHGPSGSGSKSGEARWKASSPQYELQLKGDVPEIVLETQNGENEKEGRKGIYQVVFRTKDGGEVVV